MTADAVGGVLTYALDLTRALRPHGVEVHLATMGRPLSPSQRTASERAGVAALHESDFALEWMPEPWDEVDLAGDWLLQLADELRPDVVHLNGFAHGGLPWAAPALVVAHSDVLSWWGAVHGVPAPPEWDTYRQRVRQGLDAADLVVAPTAAVLDDLRREYDLDRGVVVPNGRRADHRPALPKERLVLGAGRLWDEAKNLVRLARVAPQLPCPVVVAGDADGRDVPAGATLTGQLSWDELSLWMARAAVVAAPSSYEPFGLTALEAAQAGCALVLGDLPSQREVWGDAAVYVDPHSDEALAEALQELLADEVALQRCAGRARARAARYTADAMAAAYLQQYQGIAALTGATA